MSRQLRAFRRLLRLYPADFRARYEEQMVGLFIDLVRDTSTSGQRAPLVRLWASTIVDVLASAPKEHLRKETAVLQPVEPAVVTAAPDQPPLHRVAVVLASVPVILGVIVWIVAPGFMEPALSNPPAILGLPAGLIIFAFAFGMALLGWLVVRRSSSTIVWSGALLFLTVPALALIFMTPALILVLINVS